MSNGGFFLDANELAGKRIVKGVSLEDNPCVVCGLERGCKTPRMKPYGDYSKRIMIVSDAPGAMLDEHGSSRVDKNMVIVKKALSLSNVKMDYDTVRTHVLQCRLHKDDFPSDLVEFCYDRLEIQIQEYKPKLIICLGSHAVSRMIETKISVMSNIFKIHGDVFPSRKYGCWVSANHHPNYVMKAEKEGIKNAKDLLYDSIFKAIQYLDISLPPSILNSGENEEVGGKEAISVLEKLSKSRTPVAFDYETNQLYPYLGDPKIEMVSLCKNTNKGYVIYFNGDKTVEKAFSKFLLSRAPKEAHNAKFEEIWSHFYFGHGVSNWDWCTLVSAHVIDERKDKKSLGFQAYLESGEEYKGLVDRKNINQADHSNQVLYSSLDSRYTRAIASTQRASCESLGLNYPAKLLLRGSLAFAKMEHHGVGLDWEAHKEFKAEVTLKRDEALDFLNSNPLCTKFYNHMHRDMNFKAIDLNTLFFDILEMRPLSWTDNENPRPQINDVFFKHLIKKGGYTGSFAYNLQERNKMEKMLSTYFNAFERFADSEGKIHPNMVLWLVETFRSSCMEPNLQNIPKRDDYAAQLRRLLIPTKDLFLDVDYSGAEVRIIAMLSRDKFLCKQINDGVDTHSYWTKKIWPDNWMDWDKKTFKAHRSRAKNEFVFPLFYGSWFKAIAANLGVSERFAQELEKEFWDKYKEAKIWQESKIKEYKATGGVSTPLGFVRHAPLSVNKIINTPVQATAFHFLLDGIERGQKALERAGIESKMVLQIHDELLIDTEASEKQDIIDIMNKYLLIKPWDFTKIVPLEVDWQEGLNWRDLKKVVQ